METISIFDYIQAITSIISAGAGLYLVNQLGLTREQINQTNRWNKTNAAFTYFNTDMILKAEKAAHESLNKHEYDFANASEPITNESMNSLKQNNADYFSVKAYLNILEDYCTAIDLKALDDDVAYAMGSAMVMDCSKFLKPFIEDRRTTLQDQEVYCNLEKRAKIWSARDNARKDE